MSNSGKRLRKPKSLSLYTLEPLRALQIIWKGKKTESLEGSRGSGRGVSKNNSGHAPPPSPEQIIKVGHLSSNFQITFIIHQGAPAEWDLAPPLPTRPGKRSKITKKSELCDEKKLSHFPQFLSRKFSEHFLVWRHILSSGGNFYIPVSNIDFRQIFLDLTNSLSLTICEFWILPIIIPFW